MDGVGSVQEPNKGAYVFDHLSTPLTPRKDGTQSRGTPSESKSLRCGGCGLRPRCLPGSLTSAQVSRFENVVQRCRTLDSGEHLFRIGDPFRSIYAVNSGCFKTYTVDAEGREHVMAFHFSSEIIGMDAIYPDRHVSSCVALAHSTACIMPYGVLTKLTLEIPELQAQLLRMLSRYVVGTASMAGDFTAEERLAAFLVMVSARLREPGETSADLDLAMSRQDIANFLRLAPETVSRILARFQSTGLLRADRKHITLLDPEGLGALAACMNPYPHYG